MIFCVEDDDNIRELVIYTRRQPDWKPRIRRRDSIYGGFGV